MRRCSVGPYQYVCIVSVVRMYVCTYVGFSWRKIPRSSAYTISEKAIRFLHPDYNPVRAQKLISLSMSRQLSTRNISSKSMHTFLSNLANRQTDRQRGQKHLPPFLSEVNNLKNGTTYNYTYNGRPIESRIWCIERRHFQCPWTILTPSFKVAPFLDAEYLRNVRHADIVSLKY